MALPSFGFGLQTEPLDEQAPDRGLIGEIFAADQRDDDASLIRLPGWMRLKRETENCTAQQSATTAASGYAAHAPRAYSQDGVTFGLLVEPATTNLVQDPPDLSTWLNTVTVTSFVAPDGNTINCELEDSSGAAVQVSDGELTEQVPAILTTYTLSAWQYVSTLSAGSSIIVNDRSSGTDVPIISTSAVDTDWVFRSNTDTTDAGPLGTANLSIRPAGSAAADTGITRVWGVQLEERSYATSFIPPAAVDTLGVRDADILQAVSSLIFPDGFWEFTLTYRPHYTHDQAGLVDHNLLRVDDDNRIYFRASDANIVFRVNGDDLVSGALTFAAHDTLTVTFLNNAFRRRLTVAGALTGNATNDGTLQPALDPATLPTFTSVLGGATGSEEGADLLGLDPGIKTFEQLADERALVQMDDATGNRVFRDMLRTWAKQPGRFFDVCNGLKAALELETACGFQLDLIGAVVGLPREGFSDVRYRVFLGIQVELLLANARDDAEWTGTAPNLIRIARDFVGPAASAINFLNDPPYEYRLDVPGLVLSEGQLLARFLVIASWAGVRGIITIELSENDWDSASVVIANPGKWDSASVAITDPASWNTVLTTT